MGSSVRLRMHEGNATGQLCAPLYDPLQAVAPGGAQALRRPARRVSMIAASGNKSAITVTVTSSAPSSP